MPYKIYTNIIFDSHDQNKDMKYIWLNHRKSKRLLDKREKITRILSNNFSMPNKSNAMQS